MAELSTRLPTTASLNPVSPTGYGENIRSPNTKSIHSFLSYEGGGNTSSSSTASSSSSYLLPTMQFNDASPLSYPGMPPMPASASALGLARGTDFFSSAPLSANPASAPKQKYQSLTPTIGSKPGVDQHFRQIERAEQMLEDMRNAHLDAAFTEELRAIEEWFKVLTDVERSTSLYALLQYMSPVQIRFFSTILNSMARRSDPAALFSSGLNDYMETRQSSNLGSELFSGLKYGGGATDHVQEQVSAMQRQYYHHPGGSTGTPRPPRFSELDAGYIDGPRSAFPSSRIHDQMNGPSSGWQSVPGTARIAPPGYGTLGQQDGPPATPFSEHPSALQQSSDGNIQSPRLHRTSIDGKDSVNHPSVTAPSWRLISRPQSPSVPLKRETMITSPNMRSPNIQISTSSTSGSSSGSFGYGSKSGGSSCSSASFSSNSFSRAIPINRPGSAHAHRSPNNNTRPQNGRAGSNYGSVPASPSTSRNGSPSFSTSASSSGTGKNPEVVDVELLKADIPSWLRSLRLHKYTPVLENVRWDKLISLNDSELSALGVTAQGARSKFLKVFAQVNAELNISVSAPTSDDIAREAAIVSPPPVIPDAPADPSPITA